MDASGGPLPATIEVILWEGAAEEDEEEGGEGEKCVRVGSSPSSLASSENKVKMRNGLS